jgi:hypothetical protein
MPCCIFRLHSSMSSTCAGQLLLRPSLPLPGCSVFLCFLPPPPLSVTPSTTLPPPAGIAVRDVDDHIDLEVDVRWVGDANISLGIDLPIGG